MEFYHHLPRKKGMLPSLRSQEGFPIRKRKKKLNLESSPHFRSAEGQLYLTRGKKRENNPKREEKRFSQNVPLLAFPPVSAGSLLDAGKGRDAGKKKKVDVEKVVC